MSRTLRLVTLLQSRSLAALPPFPSLPCVLCTVQPPDFKNFGWLVFATNFEAQRAVKLFSAMGSDTHPELTQEPAIKVRSRVIYIWRRSRMGLMSLYFLWIDMPPDPPYIWTCEKPGIYS